MSNSIVLKISRAINSNLRTLKIDTIVEFAGDELETIQDWIDIAKESLEELNIRLESIKEYHE